MNPPSNAVWGDAIGKKAPCPPGQVIDRATLNPAGIETGVSRDQTPYALGARMIARALSHSRPSSS